MSVPASATQESHADADDQWTVVGSKSKPPSHPSTGLMSPLKDGKQRGSARNLALPPSNGGSGAGTPQRRNSQPNIGAHTAGSNPGGATPPRRGSLTIAAPEEFASFRKGAQAQASRAGNAGDWRRAPSGTHEPSSPTAGGDDKASAQQNTKSPQSAGGKSERHAAAAQLNNKTPSKAASKLQTPKLSRPASRGKSPSRSASPQNVLPTPNAPQHQVGHSKFSLGPVDFPNMVFRRVMWMAEKAAKRRGNISPSDSPEPEPVTPPPPAAVPEKVVHHAAHEKVTTHRPAKTFPATRPPVVTSPVAQAAPTQPFEWGMTNKPQSAAASAKSPEPPVVTKEPPVEFSSYAAALKAKSPKAATAPSDTPSPVHAAAISPEPVKKPAPVSVEVKKPIAITPSSPKPIPAPVKIPKVPEFAAAETTTTTAPAPAAKVKPEGRPAVVIPAKIPPVKVDPASIWEQEKVEEPIKSSVPERTNHKSAPSSTTVGPAVEPDQQQAKAQPASEGVKVDTQSHSVAVEESPVVTPSTNAKKSKKKSKSSSQTENTETTTETNAPAKEEEHQLTEEQEEEDTLSSYSGASKKKTLLPKHHHSNRPPKVETAPAAANDATSDATPALSESQLQTIQLGSLVLTLLLLLLSAFLPRFRLVALPLAFISFAVGGVLRFPQLARERIPRGVKEIGVVRALLDAAGAGGAGQGRTAQQLSGKASAKGKKKK